MGSNLVIVAIPDENDRVWKVSSEKVPHLTLLFLGESEKVANAQQIVEFVEHAATTTLKRFYLPVDRRDELGADKADVLFFKTKRYDGKALRDFRSMLLKDNNIKTAYDSAEQFEGWTPHLTLGYPEAPAKPDPTDRDYGFYDVSFTKIAVWMGDFEGPEFLLKDWDDEEDLHGSIYDTPLASWGDITKTGKAALEQLFGQGSDTTVEHHGVKGMRWGVTKDKLPSALTVDSHGRDRWSPEGHSTGGDVLKALVLNGSGIGTALAMPANVRLGKRLLSNESGLAKADKNWKKGLDSTKKGIEVHNTSNVEINAKLPGFNKDKRCHDKDGKQINLNSDPAKMEEYNRAFEKEIMNPAYAKAALKVHGSTSPGGRYKFEVVDPSTGLMKVRDTHEEAKKANERITHASVDDDFEVAITFNILRDASGHVNGFEWPKTPEEETVSHGEAFVDGLVHYGVKGMHWGQKKAEPTAVAPTATSKVPHGDKRKTKIQTEGGENHPAHADAIKVAQARTKLAKSGPAALSNAELREVANRVQLEQQVKQLVAPAGKKFVTGLLKAQGNQGANQLFTKKVTRKLIPA